MKKYNYKKMNNISPKFLKIEGIKLENRDFIFERLDKHNAVAMIVLNSDKSKIFLVKQFRFGSLKEMWEIPAGIIEEGMTPLETAIKELEEETGYKKEDILSIKEISGGYVSPGYSSEYINFFEIVLKEGALPGKINLDEHELIDEGNFFTYEEAMNLKAYEDLKTNYGLLYWNLKK